MERMVVCGTREIFGQTSKGDVEDRNLVVNSVVEKIRSLSRRKRVTGLEHGSRSSGQDVLFRVRRVLRTVSLSVL